MLLPVAKGVPDLAAVGPIEKRDIQVPIRPL